MDNDVGNVMESYVVARYVEECYIEAGNVMWM